MILEKIGSWIEEKIELLIFLFFILTIIFSREYWNLILPIGFFHVGLGFLGFIAVFYTIIVLKEYIDVEKNKNKEYKQELLKRLETLKQKEDENNQQQNYSNNINLIEERINIYSLLSRFEKDRSLNNLLIKGITFLILFLISMIIVSNIDFDNVYKVIFLLIQISFFWIGTYYLL